MKFQAKNRELDLSSPKIMGVLNVTPDSFSDGGKFLSPEYAVIRGLEMAEEGASLIDVGGESTRPGATPVSVEEELKRVIPVIERLCAKTDCLISIDTQKPLVAFAALQAGAHIINDVFGLSNEKMMQCAVQEKAGVILMHMQGTPQTMQAEPAYGDVVAEVKAFLQSQAKAASRAGISGVMVDPGIGFGKTTEHNLALLRHLDQFQFGYPVCLGVSRKSFIGNITKDNAQNRLEGTLSAVTAGVLAGAQVFRVHDVK
ncbi:MAG: dihydropteroate synthase, partial [Candidatus Micrarchaeota archaeon]|nr:dihydropteroate synthase [Candidatus Micrarchaeota archaeon]